MIGCFDIGGSFIRYGVPSADGLVSERGRVPTPGHDFDAFVAALGAAIADMPQPVDIVSISSAGFIAYETQQAVIANIPCLHGRILVPELERRLGLPVVFTNDADCYALAESRHGVARGKANVFAIILGSGLGGGLVIDGRLVRGHGGVAGEWGHAPIVDPLAGGLLTVPLPAIRCGCGRDGCLDVFGGARGIERIHLATTGRALDSGAIVAAWRAGDASAEKTVAVYVETVARPLTLIVTTIGIDSVPVGGGLASATDLIARLDQRVRALTLIAYGEPLVVPGLRAADGGLVGAALAGEERQEAAA